MKSPVMTNQVRLESVGRLDCAVDQGDADVGATMQVAQVHDAEAGESRRQARQGDVTAVVSSRLGSTSSA